MAEQRELSQSPQPCANGCGFFGSASTLNMCSKCFREHERSSGNENQEPSSSLRTASSSETVSGFSTPKLKPKESAGQAQTILEVTSPAVEAIDSTGRKIQKNTSRCWSCRKKIGLTGFKCVCGYTFCSVHRHAEDHECEFDYQSSAREKLKKDNPVVDASKLDKI